MDNRFRLVSQAGVLQVAGLVGLTMLIAGETYIIIKSILNPDEYLIRDIIGQPLILLLMLLLAYFLFKQKATVDQDGITSQDGWRKKHIPWKGIHRISVVPGYGYLPFAGFSILIHTTKRERPIGVQALMFYNSHEIVKAIIEMADKANSGIAIDDTLIHSYGQPPYGIVEAEKAKQVALKK